ncbi:hypothetical protein DJ82_04970 [Halorubrum sp. Ib24]|uniref:hypothetical protein n=1 Tax=Halorubrum sp. Ib24 TaxID=1383850 RepID=UPI000B9969C6|nr:hypothetical protein [Halorubrum sp. Ib24]OYR41506.1 hypothetical protein DJ82_04970 [Halorubrum sp. Ib24]
MIRRTRRTVLCGLGAGGVAALAGCTSGGDPGAGDGADGSDGTDGGDGGDGGDGDDDSDPDPETEVHQVGGALSGPAWSREERRGFAALITDESDAAWLLREAPEETVAFVEATDFDESALAYVESVGPTTCHARISFADVAVEDGTLVASASVEGPESYEIACGEAITLSGAFLRVATDARPDAIRVSVTDGWGETGEVSGEDGVLDPERLDGYVRPDGDPETLPAGLDCETDDFQRHPAVYEDGVSWGTGGGAGGDGDGLELRVVDPNGDGGAAAAAFERGDELRIELTNASGHEAYVGNRGKYNLELRTESGWREIRGAEAGTTFDYTDEAIGVRPGETLAWEFELTEAGLIEGGPHADDLRVCPDLVPGRYRFVFWGADDLAVAFDYAG